MDADYGIDEWPDGFTREEILEQHAHLLEEECRMLNEELSRYRKNMAKLIDMQSGVSAERDKGSTSCCLSTISSGKILSSHY